MLEVDGGADEFLVDVEASPLATPARWTKAARVGRGFAVAPCAEPGGCRLRYRVKLREAARRIDELETAAEEGDVLITPPSMWLLTPPRVGPAVLRFRVSTTKDTRFATGIYRAESAAALPQWDITLGDLWNAPYSAFGPLRMRTTTPKDARVDIAFGPGKLALSDDDVVAWAERSERAIVGYYGTFPMREALVIVIAGRGRMVGEGKTLGGGGGSIFLRVGERTTADRLVNDWVFTHEMVHLTFPTLDRTHHWMEEGVATYVEPMARARVGTLTREEAWKGLVEGIPHGLPRPGDEGLDRTHTWGRTYWGGALYFLYADVGIRRRTQNCFGLEHALRAINARGGNNGVRWDVRETLRIGDAAVGAPVLTELYDAWRETAVTPDVQKLWRELGVVYTGGKLTFDDHAPDAAIRRAITDANDVCSPR